MQTSNNNVNLSKETDSVANVYKKGNLIKKILKATQITAVAWSAFVIIIYLSVVFNLLCWLPDLIGEACVVVLYNGIWGAPILSLMSLLLQIIYLIRVKSKNLENKKYSLLHCLCR